MTVALAVVLTTPASASAQSPLRGLLRIGGEYGGDEVVQFTYADGSSPKVTAGGGILASIGGVYEAFTAGAHGMDVQLAAGIKYRTIPAATNQDASWLRFPVDGLLFYRTPASIRIGGGATVHLRNVLQASGAVLNDRVEFRNTPGLLLQADYARGDVAFDLRYTAMTYEVERGGSGTVGASSIGGGLTFFLGRRAGGARRP